VLTSGKSLLKTRSHIGGTYGAINYIYLCYKQGTPTESGIEGYNSSSGTTCL